MDCQLVAMQQRHADEGFGVGGAHGNAARLSIPDDRRFVNIEKGLASVSQDSASAPAEGEIERRDERRRQGQEAVEARIDDRFDLLLSLRAMHRQTDNGFAVGVHRAGYHAVVGR
jgi:hypothetical protein